jgi:branched-chain amino acid transport system ATP-binding protein
MVHVTGEVLRCCRVAKRFGGVLAVAGIDLEIAPGETVGIAGANGAGKTTLFNLIAGQLAPDEGEIHFNGHRIDGRRPSTICRLGIARTFQTTANAADRTVMENVCLAAAYGSQSARFPWRFGDQAVEAALTALSVVGLEGVEDSPAGLLSTFDQRRLMLAAALSTNPAVLLLDEPVGGLLPSEIDAMADIVGGIAASGRTLVVIEHVMSFLSRVAPQRILIMHQGAELLQGTAEEVRASTEVRRAWLGDDASSLHGSAA